MIWKEVKKELPFDSHPNLLDFVGKTALKELIALVSLARLVVVNDSGTVHIASALKKKAVVIYGPTLPSFGFTPYGVEHEILEADVYCRPCSPHGPKICPMKHHECMLKIPPEKVLEAINKLLY